MSIITYIGNRISRFLPGSINSGNAQGVFEMLDAQRDGDLFPPVSEAMALRLSTVLACVSLRSEVIGSLPLHVRDKKTKKIAETFELYHLLHDLPNAYMTTPDFGSMSVAQVDLHGNQLSHIVRHSRLGHVTSINPLPLNTGYEFVADSKGRGVYRINGMDFSPDDILHMRGFCMDGFNGLSRLQTGRNILSAQYQSNVAMMRAFKQGLKVGGFFKVNDATREPMDDTQFKQFMARMAMFSSPENMSKWMPLPPGMEPVATGGFKINPSDMQLLESMYFGTEEVCRLFNVPPPLIGHTSKASSWASSSEQLNLHFLMYSLQPTLIRREKTYWHKLMTAEQRAKYEVKHSVEGLLRSDVKTRQAFYASGLQNGYLSQNEVRDMEDRPGIGEEGDVYRVQLNLSANDPSVNPESADGGGSEK